MTHHRLLKITACFVSCLLFSCNEPDKGNTSIFSGSDSTDQALTEAEQNATTLNYSSDFRGADSAAKASFENFTTVVEANKRLVKKATQFIIKTNRDTVLLCREGTLLSMPANAFLNSSTKSPVEGEVKISVKEFYKISDMLVAGLTTTSRNRLLETGGMLNIKVLNKATNDSCILKPGKNIVIAMQNADPINEAGMRLFNGRHDSAAIDWIPRPGDAGLALGWRFGRNNVFQYYPRLKSEFIFPDRIISAKPKVISSNPEILQAEIQLPLRELLQNVGAATKKVNAYIDTLGNLHCFNIGVNKQRVTFDELYNPITYQDMKVNLAVEAKLNYKSNLNHYYYLKLFKMGKGNPDSLITTSVTLNPVVKIISIEKIKKSYSHAITITEFQKKQKQMAALQAEYEKRAKQLSVDYESKLVHAEGHEAKQLENAQNYLLLSTSNLGWINLDKFYTEPNKVDFLVSLKEPASVLIVFKRLKSIVSSDKNGSFKGLPLNEEITIVALKTEQGKLMMALHETAVTSQPFEHLKFKAVTLSEYKSSLEKLNRM